MRVNEELPRLFPRLELLSNRIESNPGAVRFGRIESDQKKFDSTRIKTNSTLDSL